MDINEAINIIKSDPGLTKLQKEELIGENKGKLTELLTGATGALLMLALAKYKKMSTISQIALSALGFGAGILVYKYLVRDRFANYNEDAKAYEINEK